jgi:hypothetical protein
VPPPLTSHMPFWIFFTVAPCGSTPMGSLLQNHGWMSLMPPPAVAWRTPAWSLARNTRDKSPCAVSHGSDATNARRSATWESSYAVGTGCFGARRLSTVTTTTCRGGERGGLSVEKGSVTTLLARLRRRRGTCGRRWGARWADGGGGERGGRARSLHEEKGHGGAGRSIRTGRH